MIIIIIIITTSTTTTTCTQDNYNYIPEINHVYRVHSFAAIRWLQFTVHVTLLAMFSALYFYISTLDVLLLFREYENLPVAA